MSVATGDTVQIPIRFVMPDNSLVPPSDYASGFTYTSSGLPTGTTVSSSGVISAGTTAGSAEVEITYTDGISTFTLPVNVEVVSA